MVEVEIKPRALEREEGDLETEEDEEEAWLKEIEEVAVQFVCLVLEDELGAQPMGGGKSPAPSLATALSDGQPPTTASRAPEIARKLKGIGDDLDAKVRKEIAEAASALLSRRSLFQVGAAQFNGLCSGVLTNCSSLLRSGWEQVGAVYMTLGQLTRSAQPPEQSAVVAGRLSRFTRQYLTEVGLDAWLQDRGGLDALLAGTGVVSDDDPEPMVDISQPD